ncbi:MAG: hypothetical protein WDA24_05770 [Tissierellales bacterium]
MANPLARVIMNNITQNSKMIDSKNSSIRSNYSISGLGQNEEQLLLDIMNKNSGKGTGILTNHSNRATSFKKVKLEDLVKGNTKTQNSKYKDNKSNTMMTLDDLAIKVKKPNNAQDKNLESLAKQQTTKDVYVKTGVINNLEACIPKVSLNSIGKKGSLL